MKNIFLMCMSVALVLISGQLLAQHTIAASGGDASGTGGSVSFTVGQVVYTTNSDASGTESQGVQQPFEIYQTVGIDDGSPEFICSLYPNPTSDFIVLEIPDYSNAEMFYFLYDDAGKLVRSGQVSGTATEIRMNQLSLGSYLLSVMNQQQVLKSFTIIKNN